MLDKLPVSLITLVLLCITVTKAAEEPTEVFLTATTDDVTEPSKELAVSGGDVKLKLVIKNYKPGTFIKWTRVNEREIVDLAQNHILDENYDDMKSRYVFSDDVEKYNGFGGDSDYKIDFTIKDFKLEDAGTYKVRDGEGTTDDQVKLSFKKPATSVKFTKDGTEVTKGTEFDITPGSLHNLKCEVSGVAPQPKLVIKGGDDDVVSGSDYTTKEIVDDDTLGDSQIFYAITYGATLKGEDVVFDAKYANKDIYCEVDVGGEVLKSESFRSKFPGKPPVWDKNCVMEAIEVPGAQDKNLSCTVNSDPKASIRFVWHYHNPAAVESIEITADTPRKNLPPFYRAAVEEVDEETQKATLFIDIFKQQMFRNYSFIAKNELGESSYIVNVSYDPTHEVKTSSGSRVLATSSLIITAIYFLLH